MKALFTFILVFTFGYSLSSQILNAGFENWDTTYSASNSKFLLSEGVPGAISGFMSNWNANFNYDGICRTTDATEGNYSIILHNWYSYVSTSIRFSDSINYRPKFLTGDYKYEGMPVTHGIGSVVLTDTSGDTLGESTYFFDTSSDFKSFSIKINYLSENQPDSIFIIFTNSNLKCPDLSVNYCNFLYLDNLKFVDSVSLDIKKVATNRVKVYPNPARDILYCENITEKSSINIYTVAGQLAKEVYGRTEVDIADLAPGLYFINIWTKEGDVHYSNKFMIH